MILFESKETESNKELFHELVQPQNGQEAKAEAGTLSGFPCATRDLDDRVSQGTH